MYAITVVGFACWLAFGIMKREWPIIITNGVCLVLSAFILLMTVLPRSKKNAVADALDPSVEAKIAKLSHRRGRRIADR